MKRFCVSIVTAFVLIGVPVASGAEPPAAPFKAGFAERDITPAIGMEAPGGYGKAFHQTLHDPCKVRAAVFDDGTKQVAVVGVDGLGIRRDTVLKARKTISEKVGLAAENILIGASHSHSSGPLLGVMPHEYDNASPLVQKLAYEQTTGINLEYLAKVDQALVDTVCEAFEKRTDAQGGVGKGIETKVAFNRRFRMRSGGTFTHPGAGNPEIVEPAGPVDPEVGVIGAWGADGKLLGCVVNFACHATTSPGGISANYVCYLERAIQGYFGPQCVVVFAAGASGDITQVDNRTTTQNPAPDHWAQRVGGRVGAEAVKVLLSMDRGPLGPINARSKVWNAPRRQPTAERVKECLALVENPPAGADVTRVTFAKEIVLLDALLQKEKEVEVEIQAVQVGPAVFVSNPAEYFCQYGLDIKAGAGFPFTFPVSLANGCVGYVPTEESFGPNGGGYETRLTSYSNLEITAGNKFRDVGIELAKQLSPGRTPAALDLLPFTGQPWAYGAVPPEKE